ncbi:MAG TPA: hypothetical protein VMB50_02650 [Myxococcales bacterium]|nr:hypothetical protein [Myxococcales bacterium]
MARCLALAALLAWSGFASCEDPDRVKAAVKAVSGDATAEVECHEPSLWYSQKNWRCKSYLRGQTRCFEVHTLEEGRPWEVECPHIDPNKQKVDMPW